MQASRAPRLPLLLAAWALAALAASASGALAHLPRPFFALFVIAAVAALVRTRALDRVPLAPAIAWHVPRALIGVAFLASPQLPRVFAVPAGYGDLVAGLGAVLALVALRRGATRVVLAWNVVAFVDILLVVVNAQRLVVFADARPFLAFPFPVLPLFFVPTVIASHVLVFRRLRQR